MRVAIVPIVLFLFVVSCKSEKGKTLICGSEDLWRITQIGQKRSDSSMAFYRFNPDNTLDEINFIQGQFRKTDSHPDVVGWQKWKQIDDSIFQIAYVNYRLIQLTDTFALFANIKRPKDSLRFSRVIVQNNSFTSYR